MTARTNALTQMEAILANVLKTIKEMEDEGKMDTAALEIPRLFPS